MDALTFDQWVLFIAVQFRLRYRVHAERFFPELAPQLPLTKGGKLTVVQVNSGEAVHFIFTGTPSPQHTDCRHLTVEPPEGMTLRDWALLHGDGYKRFVERVVPGPRIGHFVLFPGEDDEHAAAVTEADRIVREHAEGLRTSA